MTWDELRKIHRKQRAVFILNHELKSLLLSEDRSRHRKNYVEGDTLIFCFPPPMQKSEFELLIQAQKERKKIKVFRKFGVNNYKDVGFYRIIKHEISLDSLNRETIKFFVKPAKDKKF